MIPALSTALRDGRVADALALYEPDAVFIPQPNAQPVTGRDALEQAFSQFAAPQPQLTWSIRNVVVAGEVATVINDWQLGRLPVGALPLEAVIADQLANDEPFFCSTKHWSFLLATRPRVKVISCSTQ